MNYESEFIMRTSSVFAALVRQFQAVDARQAPARCALKYRGEEVGYAAFDQRIRIVGGWLAARGIGPNDVVAVLMKNSPAFLEIAFAASHIGAIFLPINYRLASEEIAYIVENFDSASAAQDRLVAALPLTFPNDRACQQRLASK